MNIKIQSLRILFLFLITTGFVSAQTFKWSKDIKSQGYDEGYDLATDPVGNTYVGGMIEYDAHFTNGLVLHSAGIHDIFLAKYDSLGKVVWAKRAGGKGGDKIQSIALDGMGHIYAAGEYEDTAYFDNIMKFTGSDTGVNNMFVAKYDTSGAVMWVRNIRTSGILHTRGYGVTCDAQGNVYACGGIKGDAYYDSLYLFTTAGDYDGSIVKFDPDGNFVWARRLGGTDSDKAYGIVSDNNGSIYVTGYFVGVADFSPTVNLTGHGHTDIFLAKYDTSGLLQWVKQAGDTGFDRGWDVTRNINGQIIITGEFQTGYFGTNLVHSRGNEDMFLAAYDSNGNNVWALSGGSAEDDIGRGVSHDTIGNIYVIGDYASSGIFPPDTVYSNGYADVFLACYNSSGTTLKWIRSSGGPDSDRGRGVGTDPAGNISICGEYVDSIRFDNYALTGDLLLDIFVARLRKGTSCAVQANATAQNLCHGMCNGSAIALVSAGQAPYSYEWSTTPHQYSATATNLCAGTYSVTITDALGCSSNASVTLADPPLLQVSATSSNATCFALCNGSASASATGNGPFTFSWSTSPVQTGATASGLCQGTYLVTTTDASACTSTASVTLTDPQQLQLSANAVNATCAGSCNGIASVIATGENPFFYNWTTTPPQHDSTASGLCQGNYSVLVTDSRGCTSMASVTLTDPAVLQLAATGTNANCTGSCDGSATAVASGGQGSFSYQWNTNPPQSGATVSSLCQGTYTVVSTDQAGCTTSSVVTLTDPIPLVIGANIVNASCIGCTNGSINLSAVGGTPSYQYLWSNGLTTEDLQQLAAGIYSVCVTDANNCSICDTFTVLQPGSGIATANSSFLYSLYPNPFINYTTIHLNIPLSSTTTATLYSVTGQLIYQTEMNTTDLIISSEGLSNGMYFLQLRNSSFEGMSVIPLVVQK